MQFLKINVLLILSLIETIYEIKTFRVPTTRIFFFSFHYDRKTCKHTCFLISNLLLFSRFCEQIRCKKIIISWILSNFKQITFPAMLLAASWVHTFKRVTLFFSSLLSFAFYKPRSLHNLSDQSSFKPTFISKEARNGELGKQSMKQGKCKALFSLIFSLFNYIVPLISENV